MSTSRLTAHWALLADQLRAHLDELERDVTALARRERLTELRIAIRKFEDTLLAFRP